MIQTDWAELIKSHKDSLGKTDEFLFDHFTLAARYDIIVTDKGSPDMADNKFNKSEYDMDYQRNHKTRMTLWFNNDKDNDILEWLNEIEMNKSEYIRDLIRKDIKKNNAMFMK